jgi:hypothetical protein
METQNDAMCQGLGQDGQIKVSAVAGCRSSGASFG